MLLNTSRPSGSWLAAISTRPLRGKRPPSDRGLNTPARSCRPVGGKARPSSGQSSPVPLATAAISIAALVPSVKELYIFGVEVALGDLFLGPAEEAPDSVRASNSDSAARNSCPCRLRSVRSRTERTQSTSSQIMAGWSPYAML